MPLWANPIKLTVGCRCTHLSSGLTIRHILRYKLSFSMSNSCSVKHQMTVFVGALRPDVFVFRPAYSVGHLFQSNQNRIQNCVSCCSTVSERNVFRRPFPSSGSSARYSAHASSSSLSSSNNRRHRLHHRGYHHRSIMMVNIRKMSILMSFCDSYRCNFG